MEYATYKKTNKEGSCSKSAEHVETIRFFSLNILELMTSEIIMFQFGVKIREPQLCDISSTHLKPGAKFMKFYCSVADATIYFISNFISNQSTSVYSTHLWRSALQIWEAKKSQRRLGPSIRGLGRHYLSLFPAPIILSHLRECSCLSFSIQGYDAVTSNARHGHSNIARNNI